MGDPFENDKLVGIANGQRAKKCSINQAEDGGVRSDAEREGDDCHGRERGRFAQYSHCEAQILNEVLNPIYAAGVAALLFGLLDTAQVDSRAAVRLLLRHPLRPAKQRPQPQWNRVQPMLRSHSPDSPLLVSQSHYRIDVRGAAGGYITSGEGDKPEKKSNRQKCKWIKRANAVKQAGKIAC